MLRVLSSPKRLCDGVTRRDLLQVGGLSFGGLGLSQLLAQQSSASSDDVSGSFGRAKQCIILFLYGSPSQLETFDMKPEAPAEIRGTMQPIASSLPGLDVCEHLPEMSKIMDRTTVVRSCTHPYPLHGVAHAMTGVQTIDVAMELNPRDERHHPYFGSCVEYVDRQRRGGRRTTFCKTSPCRSRSAASERISRTEQGRMHLIWVHRTIRCGRSSWEKETEVIRKERAGGAFWFEGPEPYLGTTQDSHFRLAAVEPLPDLTLDRLSRRRSLVQQFDDARSDLERTRAGDTLSTFQQMAYSLVGSKKVREALDCRHETAKLS